MTISGNLKTDLLEKYIGGYAPYISKLVYDLDMRKVIFIFEKLTEQSLTRMQLQFNDVLSFSEEVFEDAFDENFTDSVLGMHLISSGVYCVRTEKRELMIRVGSAPVSGLI